MTNTQNLIQWAADDAELQRARALPEPQRYAYLTRTIADLIRTATACGAGSEVVVELWELRGMPEAEQWRQLPEWLQVCHEWRAALAG